MGSVWMGPSVAFSGTLSPRQVREMICAEDEEGRQQALDKLVGALDKALNYEGTKKRLLDLGTVLPTAEERTPAGFAALIKRDADKLTPALASAPK